MNQDELKRVIQQFIVETPCPKCGKQFRSRYVYLAAFLAMRGLFLVGCNACKFTLLLEISFERDVIKVKKIQGTGVTMHTIRQNSNFVSLDDVVEVKNALNGFRGDFAELFQA